LICFGWFTSCVSLFWALSLGDERASASSFNSSLRFFVAAAEAELGGTDRRASLASSYDIFFVFSHHAVLVAASRPEQVI
jgi:hypothetical protein